MSRPRAILVCFAMCLALPEPAAAQVHHLEMLQPPQLVRCGAGASADARYFRVVVNAVDEDRKPVRIPVNKDDVQVFEDGRRHEVIYVSAFASDASGGSRGNYVMLLLDTSGSMNRRLRSGETRFEAVRKAVAASLGSFEDGTDLVSVVPFNSRNVVSQVRSAEIQPTRSGVERQLTAIDAPRRDANTALYSATYEALDVLNRRAGEDYAVSLVVLTDGENDVNRPGDDPGLFGDEGLEKVTQRASEISRVPVTTVRFGDPNPKLEAVLRRMAWPNETNYFDATVRPEILREIFENARRKLSDRVHILVGPVRDRREDLRGQSIRLNVVLRRPGGERVSSEAEPEWNSPAGADPLADTMCIPAEAAAIDALGAGPPPGSALPEKLTVFITLAVVLAAFWFGAPRLVWPQMYVPRPTFQVPSTPAGVPSLPQPQLPQFPSPGRGGGSAGLQGSGDRTVLVPPRGQPRPEGGSPRHRPSPAQPERPRGGDDPTIYIPPDKNPGRDR